MQQRFKQLAGLFITSILLSGISSWAQNTADSTFKPSGKLWGLAFADFAYKAESDPLNRDATNQYTGIKKNEGLFQFRRIYLGYDYNISKKFSAEFVLASEENETTSATSAAVTTGDLLVNNKLSMYIKIANLRWKNIFRGTDLVFGQVVTPAFPMMSESIWDYRSIERTVTDIRRTPSFDMGASLQGQLYGNERTKIGYDLMVGNGTSARPETDAFKTFYGDVYVKLFNKKLVIDLYSDYTKLNWTPTWHHDRCMAKLFVAYTTPKLTVGVEAFTNSLMNDSRDSLYAGGFKMSTTKAMAVSVFARGRIYKDKLGFFARYDNYDPSMSNENDLVAKYTPTTANYDPNTREQFVTLGVDYTPFSKVHIMPNVWYNAYTNAGPINYGANNKGTDLVFRLTFYYIYGK